MATVPTPLLRDSLVNFILPPPPKSPDAWTIELWKFQLWSQGETVVEIDAWTRYGEEGREEGEREENGEESEDIYTTECIYIRSLSR